MPPNDRFLAKRKSVQGRVPPIPDRQRTTTSGQSTPTAKSSTIVQHATSTTTNGDCRRPMQLKISKVGLGLAGAVVALMATSALGQLAGKWVWETPPTDCSNGRGVSFNLVQDGSAVSGTWDEFSTNNNGGRLSGVMLDDRSALVSICDESGNGLYPACPDYGREFRFLTLRRGELWVFANKNNQNSEHAQFIPSVTLEPDTPHRRALADKRLQETIRGNGGTLDGLFCNETAWPRYIGRNPDDGGPVTIDIPKAVFGR
ncbi:hypothetical protein LMG24238_01085 [Paraburkholderia sediminicola]|uniref:Uncharacterized protein n=1 Tax=Paraburkholderia sediminicola TaxID=458836 RepID=A0A6J5AKT8_9BURK|nr:hypothetical protein LMG24238_01085 [Paraburkholderia sediminicola]